MNISQGTVEVLTAKPAGKGTAYNFKLSDGNWYGYGFEKPSFDKGSNIKFSWEANGNWKNVDASSVEIVESSAPVVHKTAGKAAAVDWDGKDKRITFLACRKDSIQIAAMALEHGALKLGSKGDKLAVLTGFVDEVANDLYTGIYGEKYPVTEVTVEAVEQGVANDEE